jgi:hypothetical protein
MEFVRHTAQCDMNTPYILCLNVCHNWTISHINTPVIANMSDSLISIQTIRT